MNIQIITCPQWGAVQPNGSIVTVPKAKGVIFHHTDGHLRQIDNPFDESREEACRYARDIQRFHMGPERGWKDSGHNFLVTRGGHILQGRWGTVTQIEQGKMVESAHCPGYNTWVGVEHEHKPGESATLIQLEMAALLQAWVAFKYGRKTTLAVDPHRAHFATSCPDVLEQNIPSVRKRAGQILAKEWAR